MWGFGKKKQDVFDVLYGRGSRSAPASAPVEPTDPVAPVTPVAALGSYQAPIVSRWDDGDKWPGGFGPTKLLTADYWTLRARSVELFETNQYARGIIRRLVTNEINTGLHLEATPEETVLGFEKDSLSDWTESTEVRFSVWATDPKLCDHYERLTFGALQALARMEALIAGDVLVVLRQDQRTGLPRIQLISGESVQTPALKPVFQNGTKIDNGVEIDAQGRHVAYWILQDVPGSFRKEFKRLPAYGEKSGRRLAWLYYGGENRVDAVRGKPMLAHVLQALKEIDRYRDSTQRKATVNSTLAMFVEKAVDKPGSHPLTAGATLKGQATTVSSDGVPRRYAAAEYIPGLVIDELQVGETIKAHPSNGTDEKFGDFERAILAGIAWHFGIPPEILLLAFGSNYSASQAAINEFKMHLNRVRTDFGDGFCQPIYTEWLIAQTLRQMLEAKGLLDAWRDPARREEFAAWVASDWAGHIKPAVDLSKLVRGYTEMVAEGFITRDRASRELTGTKYSKNVAKLKLENEQLAEANESLVELEMPPAPAPSKADAEGKDDTEPADDGEDAQAA